MTHAPLFQSTADPLASRTARSSTASPGSGWFQSTADPLASRTLRHVPGRGEASEVSIHGRPVGQPHRRVQRPWRRVVPVSIHGRPVGQPHPGVCDRGADRGDVSIHGRPVGQPHRSNRLWYSWTPACFNPRPTRWPAAPRVLRGLQVGERVSIHGRPVGQPHRRRSSRWPSGPTVSIHGRPVGQPHPVADGDGVYLTTPFQSTADPLASRTRLIFFRRFVAGSFQSTADPLASRTRRLHPVRVQLPPVSIHGRPVGQPHPETRSRWGRQEWVSIHGRPVGQPHRPHPQDAANNQFREVIPRKG